MAVLAYMVRFRTEWNAYIIQNHPWNKDTLSILLYDGWCSSHAHPPPSPSHMGCWTEVERRDSSSPSWYSTTILSPCLWMNTKPTCMFMESPVIHRLSAASFSLTNSSARSVNHPSLAISHIPYTQTERVGISPARMFLYTTLKNRLKQKLLHSWIDWLWRRMAEEIFWLPSWNGEKKSNSAAEQRGVMV